MSVSNDVISFSLTTLIAKARNAVRSELLHILCYQLQSHAYVLGACGLMMGISPCYIEVEWPEAYY